MATSGDDIAVAPSMAVSGSGPEHPHPLQGVPPPPSAGVLHQPNPFFKPQNVGSVGIVGGVAQLAVLPGAMGQGASLVDNARRGPQPTICEHQLPKSKCKKCKAMARICKHGKKKELCRECDGSALCVHDLRKKECRQCDGSALCVHNKIRRECKECGGSSYCEHGKRKRRCRDCGGMDFCEHDRRKGQCKECGGSQICHHNRQKFRCKDCFMCVHYRVKSRCPECIQADSEKDSRKIPRGQGWNAKRLRDDGVDEGKAVDDGKGMETTVDGMAGGSTVNKAATRGPTVVGIVGGIKRDSGLGRTMQPGKGSPPVGSQAWEAEKAQLVQENQQLRSAAAIAATEAEERRRAAAELEKAKAEIERLKHLLGSPACKPVLDKDLPPQDKDLHTLDRDLQPADKDFAPSDKDLVPSDRDLPPPEQPSDRDLQPPDKDIPPDGGLAPPWQTSRPAPPPVVTEAPQHL